MTATEVVEARTPVERAHARALVEEYAAGLAVDLDFQGFREEIARFPGEYAPPDGLLLLAIEDGEPVGVVGLRKLTGPVCEMKRLYVRRAARGRGLGRALAERLLEAARRLGYHRMRLDTLPDMTAAIRLYRELGFREVPPYRYNPLPGATFMELDLQSLGGRPER